MTPEELVNYLIAAGAGVFVFGAGLALAIVCVRAALATKYTEEEE
jgi:hypothetical protein